MKDLSIDICFNQCEGYRGDSREAQVPALLEMLGIPYTGSKVMTLALTLDKAMTKRVLMYHGLPTPPFQEFVSADDPTRGAAGRSVPSVCQTEQRRHRHGHRRSFDRARRGELRERVAYLLEAYHEPVLVEKYIEGNDVTVGLVGNYPDLHLFPISMIDNALYEATGVHVYGSELKIDQGDAYQYQCPAPLPDGVGR